MKSIAEDDSDPWYVERAKEILESDYCEPRNPHIPASPLFELSSIKISRNLFLDMDVRKGYVNDVRGLKFGVVIEFYGHIRLVDDNGNVFTLFKLDRKDAKTMVLEDTFSLILRKSQLGTPRCLPKHLGLHILLKDRIRDVVFCEDWAFLYFSEGDCNDLMLDTTYFSDPIPESPFRSALKISCTISYCALLACVSVTFLSVVSGSDQIDSEEVKLKLGASIILGNRKVFHELLDESLNLKFGVSTELCVLAVPAYSPLQILADLKFDGEETIVSELEFIPVDTRYGDEYEKEIVGQKCKMLVNVTWKHAFDKLPENYLREWNDAPSDDESEELDWKEGSSFEEKQKSLEELMEMTSKETGVYIQPQLQSLCDKKWLTNSCPEELVELFCVSICSFDDLGDVLSLTGEMDAYEITEIKNCFSVHELEVGILYPQLSQYCITAPNFGMFFDLEDAKGHQISRGFLEYSERILPEYNRRLCSIVPGKHGYAAAYYTVFQDATQARVKFTLLTPEKGGECRVCGSINGRYSNYNYSTNYEKNYFQSILYEKGKSVLVKGGDELPLRKSVIAVPSIASLILKVDLSILVKGECVETIRGKVSFKPRDCDTEDLNEQQIINGLNSSSTYCLLVYVVWGYQEFVQKFDNCSISS
ncbi:uncharacterized protein LOC110683552 [Chenopodium quinoa]|uniref:uncharacterized protein LOC110683552 n=1 Tax=Chenopodium quinoa TaxID=63459 RepID=UPI000B796BAE|nr:uncharacterized protein LOC110683552 [Chenopodium quinoa]